MSKCNGNTMFSVGGAVRCDCQCLEGCSRKIGSNAVYSQVMEDLGCRGREFGLHSVGSRGTPSQRKENF